MLTLWAKVRGYVIGIGAVIVGILAAIIVGFRRGSASATASIEATQTRAVNDALVKQTQIIEQVHSLPDGAAAQELKKSWSRD